MIVILVIVAVLFIVAVNIAAWRPKHEWHEAPFRPDWMRRKIDGQWQYREMTYDETAESFSRNAW